MDALVVSVVGDSLSLPLKRDLRHRGPLIDVRDMLVPYEKTFPALMQLRFPSALGCHVLVNTNARRGATTVEAVVLVTTELREFQPHYMICTVGTSDARFRPTGLRRAGGRLWQKVGLREFEENLRRLVLPIVFCRTTLIIVGILPCGSELLRKYPDSSIEFARYNAVLRAIAAEAGGVFLDMSDLAESIDEHVAPDGFHYGPSAHQHVANRILEVIRANRSSAH